LVLAGVCLPAFFSRLTGEVVVVHTFHVCGIAACPCFCFWLLSPSSCSVLLDHAYSFQVGLPQVACDAPASFDAGAGWATMQPMFVSCSCAILVGHAQ
jgi:hypothetical protein